MYGTTPMFGLVATALYAPHLGIVLRARGEETTVGANPPLGLSINGRGTKCLQKDQSVYDRAVRAQSTPGLGAGATGAPQRLDGGTFLMWECAPGQSPHPCVSRIAGGRGQVAGGVNKRRRQTITESDGRGRPDVLTARIIERS